MSVALADAPSGAIKRKAGRPPAHKATPELIKATCEAINRGLSIESALILQNIPKTTVPGFLKQNPLAEAEFEKAERIWEDRILSYIHAKAPTDAKCSTWLLERRQAHRWAPLAKNEISGPNGGPIHNLTLGKQLLATVAVGEDKAKREPKRPVSMPPRAKGSSPVVDID